MMTTRTTGSFSKQLGDSGVESEGTAEAAF